MASLTRRQIWCNHVCSQQYNPNVQHPCRLPRLEKEGGKQYSFNHYLRPSPLKHYSKNYYQINITLSWRNVNKEYDQTPYLNNFLLCIQHSRTSFLCHFLRNFLQILRLLLLTQLYIIHLMTSYWYLTSRNKQWCHRGGIFTFQSSIRMIVLTFQRDISDDTIVGKISS